MIRKEQVCKLLQKELGLLFLAQAGTLFDHAFISVTAVYLGKDFGVAKVYVSFALNKNSEELIKKIENQSKNIRRLLGNKLAGKMRRIPDLQFYRDDSVVNGAHVTALIDQLGG
ncbi:MAG: 30S ribosome-binding factor RbfA [Amoebophilaceae bacterium]|nr:30S ribosome-binding factor RbfA [Amoebophilaceae bacterium]